MIALVVAGVGLVLLVLVAAVLWRHVRRFGRARAALRATVRERTATLRVLRDARRRGPDEPVTRARRLRAT